MKVILWLVRWREISSHMVGQYLKKFERYWPHITTTPPPPQMWSPRDAFQFLGPRSSCSCLWLLYIAHLFCLWFFLSFDLRDFFELKRKLASIYSTCQNNLFMSYLCPNLNPITHTKHILIFPSVLSNKFWLERSLNWGVTS